MKFGVVPIFLFALDRSIDIGEQLTWVSLYSDNISDKILPRGD